MARQPMTLKQMDKLYTIMSRLDTLIEEVGPRDSQIRYELDEAARRLSAASYRAQGADT